jgi:beta-glucosidase
MTVSDANAIAECVDHGIAEDRSEAAKLAIEAGTEMDMTSDAYFENLEKLVSEGRVDEKILDRAVADILRVKYEIGLFDDPYKTSEDREKNAMLKKEYRALSKEAAVKSIVLLKNEEVLPISENTKIAVFGELANLREQMTGAWSIGADAGACVSINDALETLGISRTYEPGIKDGSADKEAVIKAAGQAEVLICAMGENKEESGEASSKADISLPKEQIELFDALVETGKPVVVILFNGRPLAIPHIAEKAGAIIEAWHLGTEAGSALIDIIYGKENPSGKLTTTFPYASGQCPMYYAHPNTGRPGGKSKFTSKYLDVPVEPLYPFGYGLSYTRFDYSNLKAEQKEDGIQVSVTVKNVGKFKGTETVQCYIRDVSAKRVRPVKQLKSFKKVTIDPGDETEVWFNIPISELGYIDFDMQYVVEDGEFIIFVGGNSRDTLEKSVYINMP